jgi:4-hydroxy-tetrahydrodipicolinate synthase
MAVLPFEGIYVPPVTPFLDGALDEASLRRLVDYLIDAGVTGIVPCGTTGESATLSPAEHIRVIEISIEQARGRVPVIAGSGSNSTSEAIELSLAAQEAGADALLMVSPYYNRPSQAGILAHFREVAKRVTLPIIIYNIPYRTGQNVEPETIVELSRIANYRGIKQSTAEIAQAQTIIRQAQDFSVLSGDDALIFPIACLGGKGAISAPAHFVPDKFLQMYEKTRDGDLAGARELHYRLAPLVASCFCEPNPGPIKAGLRLMGVISSDECRLPMLAATDACRESVRVQLETVGLM